MDSNNRVSHRDRDPETLWEPDDDTEMLPKDDSDEATLEAGLTTRGDADDAG
jgi:hypothetical protein